MVFIQMAVQQSYKNSDHSINNIAAFRSEVDDELWRKSKPCPAPPPIRFDGDTILPGICA
ncbi:MAG: hypothetical protein A3J49_09745 [Gallionellales bacterium RIFCSPHIGHO2_02_FULL_57_16]|nr:MAG: hypothetical protein A3J49_09745 [Gallionellales bacterium RIFCSPHIGHO2_02_FULL_57_16]